MSARVVLPMGAEMHLILLRKRFALTPVVLPAFILFCFGSSTAQLLQFFPAADSITVLGSCTPPGLTFHLTNIPGGVDTISILPVWAEMHLGDRSGGEITQCGFAVRDSLDLNSYQILIRYLWPIPGDPQLVNYDSAFGVWGSLSVQLLSHNDSGWTDSMQVRFHAETLGDVESSQTSVPDGTRLFPNFPNPFNPSTTITYQLAQSSHVTMKIFDVLGREVASLVDSYVHAGTHTVECRLPPGASGAYLCKLQAGLWSQTIRIAYLR